MMIIFTYKKRWLGLKKLSFCLAMTFTILISALSSQVMASSSTNYQLTTFTINNAGSADAGISSSYNLTQNTLGDSITGEVQSTNIKGSVGFISTLGNVATNVLSKLLIKLEAEDMSTKTTGGAGYGGWIIWNNGYIEETVTFPDAGIYEFEIIARGPYVNGAWPNMELRLNQNKITNFTVNSNSWNGYKKQINVTQGNHRVAVAFTNDHYSSLGDRNLYVDKVIIRKIIGGPVPSKPTLDIAITGDAQVDLSWNAVTQATGYKIKYGTSVGVYGTSVNAGNVTTHKVNGLVNGTTYYFVVTAYNANGESEDSNELNAVPVAMPTKLLIKLEAEDMSTKTTGGAGYGGWIIWNNGYIEETVTFPDAGIYEFEIIARGPYVNGAWPNMELRLNQNKITNFTVNSNSWNGYKKQINVTQGNHRVAVAFTNDHYSSLGDRNLYVDKVIIRKIIKVIIPTFYSTTIEYQYDDLNRLKEVIHDSTTTSTFDYDEVGNILNKTDF